jgi:broad specificity phosphatase PhoE
VRHGSVIGAETRRFIGHLDVPLSPLGEAQIAALAERLRAIRFDAIYCSDLLRTRRSAEILAAPHRLTPITDPALREFAMGDWDGLTADEIRALDAVAFTAWMADVGRFQFPRGESLPDLEARVLPAFEAIVGRHGGRTVAVVAHGGSNRAILCHALELGPERLLALGQDYAALSVLERAAGRWTLRMLNHCEPCEAPTVSFAGDDLVVPSRG